MLIVNRMLILFLIMLIGFVAYKCGMITDEVSKKLSGIILNIANPAIILNSVLENDISQIGAEDMVLTMFVAVGMYAALLLTAEIVVRVLPVGKSHRGMYRVMTVFSNTGYMGFPIIQAVLGGGALVYAAVFLIPFNILIYTYGVLVMKQGREGGRKFQIRTVFNNGVIACILMLVIIITGIRLPSLVTETVSCISGMVVPVSMMIIGSSLARMKLRELVSDFMLLVYSLIRQIAVPAAGYLIAKQFVDNETLLGVTLIMLATPIGSLTAMIAQEYGGDEILAARGIALTTLMSVVTLPLVFAIVGAW